MSKKPKQVLKQNWVSSTCRSKKDVLKFLSVNNIVVPPAKTGKDNNNKKAVTKTAQINSGILPKLIPGAHIFKIVVIKFIDPNIEEIPARCKLNIAISTKGSECSVVYYVVINIDFDYQH